MCIIVLKGVRYMNDVMKTPKMTPRIQSTLKHTVEVPEVMYKASVLM